MSIDHLLARQAGVISLGQAVAHGMSARTVQRRARGGSWERLHPQVYLAGGHRYTDEVRIRAASLWAGEHGVDLRRRRGVLARDAADGADGDRGDCVARAKPRPQAGIRIRRRDLPVADQVWLRDVWVTGAPLSALETAVTLPEGSAFLDRALQRHVRFPALYRAFCRNMGRARACAGSRMLMAAADRADSAAERLLVRILRQAAVPGWVLGHPFGPYRIDLAFPAAAVAVEVDGWAWHVDAERFRADRRKGNALVRAGWDLLRFTWHDLANEPGRVLDEIRATLAIAAA